MEIRRRIPVAMSLGDVIFIVRKGDHGVIVGACRVTSLIRESVSYFCNYRRSEHILAAYQIKDYAGEARFLFGIGLEKLKVGTWGLTVRSFGFERPPQWFYRIGPENNPSLIDRVLKIKTI